MDGPVWLGLDVGTSALKAVLVDSRGEVVARATEPYPLSLGPGGQAEQEPSDYLRAAARAIAACGRATEVEGIGLTGQTPTIILVDPAGRPLRPALTWQDRRAEAEAAELAQQFGPSTPIFGTDLSWTPGYPPAKLLWLARHEPETVVRTRWVLHPKDFVGYSLTGQFASDAWSSKGLCNVIDSKPARELLERVGWSPDTVPPMLPPWSAAGAVTSAAATVTGLRTGTPVAVGCSDAVAGMLAVGVLDQPGAFVLTGTSSIIGISSRSVPSATAPLFTLPTSCSPIPVVFGPTSTSGASIEWLARVVSMEPAALMAHAAEADDDEDAMFVPYLSGERAPVWRPDARGAFLGLSLSDTPASLARAVIRGVCLSEAHVLSEAERILGGKPAAQVAIGGRGVASEPWRSARVKALGRPIQVLDDPDASAIGAARLGRAASTDGSLGSSPLARRFLEFEPTDSDVAVAEREMGRYLNAVSASLEWADSLV